MKLFNIRGTAVSCESYDEAELIANEMAQYTFHCTGNAVEYIESEEIYTVEDREVLVGTHDGIFHQDEVMAVTYLNGFYNNRSQTVKVIRTRNPEILATCHYRLDVGGVNNPLTGDFDPHQDKNLKVSAFGLLMKHYAPVLALDYWASKFFGEFVAAVDAADTDLETIKTPNLPGLRYGVDIFFRFNRVEFGDVPQYYAFEKAVFFARDVLANELLCAQQKGRAEVEYSGRTVLPNGVAIFRKFSPIWKDKKDHVAAILPYTQPGQWQLMAADLTKWVIPVGVSEAEGFIFRDNSGFMATFSSYEAALSVAEKLKY